MNSNRNSTDNTTKDLGHQIGLLNDEFSTLSSVWRELQHVKMLINAEKQAALASVDERFAAQLVALEEKYALVLRMSI